MLFVLLLVIGLLVFVCLGLRIAFLLVELAVYLGRLAFLLIALLVLRPLERFIRWCYETAERRKQT